MSGPGTTVAQGGLAIGGTAPGIAYLEFLSGRTLFNDAAATLSSTLNLEDGYYSGLFLGDGATLINQAGASFDITGDVPFLADSSSNDLTLGSAIVNYGAFDKTGGAGASAVSYSYGYGSVAFDEAGSGSLQVTSGTVEILGGGSSTDSSEFGASNGGVLLFPAQTSYSMGGATAITGDGVIINGATVSIDGSVSATNLEFDSGTISGAGTLTAINMLWTNGTMTGSGSTVIVGVMTLGVAGSNNAQYLDGRTLAGAGEIDLVDAGFVAYDGAVVQTTPTGVFNLTDDLGIAGYNNTLGSFENEGLLVKTGGTGTSVILLPVSSYGTISAKTGTISLQGGGSSAGTADFDASGGTVTFPSGSSFSWGDGTSITGDGVTITGATVGVEGEVSASNLEMVSGTLACDFALDADNFVFDSGTLTGAGTLTAVDLIWTGGTMTGTGSTVATGNLTLGAAGSTDQEFVDGRTLANAGQGTVADEGFFVYDGAEFHNTIAGIFVLPTGLDILGYNGSYGYILNEGSLVSTGGAGTSVIQLALVNEGSLTVETGTLSLQGNGSDYSAEPMQPLAGATLDFNLLDSTATFTIAAGSAGIVGAGTATFTAGTVDDFGGYNVPDTVIQGGSLLIEGTGTTDSLSLSAGILGGSGTMTATGQTDWSGGEMLGFGTLYAAGGLTIGPPESLETLFAYTIVNETQATLDGASLFVLDVGDIENLAGATFSLINDGNINGFPLSGRFDNYGTLVKSSGPYASVIQIPLENTGTVVSETGTLSLAGGGTDFSSVPMVADDGAALDFNGGTFFVRAGSAGISAATGTISFSGGYVAIESGSGGVVGGSIVSIQGGDVQFYGPYNVGTTRISAGYAEFMSTATTDTLTQTGGSLGGDGQLTVLGSATWTGGSMIDTGTTVVDGPLTIGQDGTDDQATLSLRTLDLLGQATLAGNSEAALSVVDAATLDIRPGASLAILDDAGIAPANTDDVPGLLIDEGLLVKSGGTTASGLAVTLHVTGTISAGSGSLILFDSGTGASGSVFDAAAGAFLEFTEGSSFTFEGGTTLSGDGIVSMYYATITLDGPVTATNFSQDAGLLTGPGDLTITGAFTEHVGQLGGTGIINVAPGGSIDMQDDADYVGYRTINNEGTSLTPGNAGSFVSTDNTYSDLASYLEGALSTLVSQASDEISSNPVPLLGGGDSSTYLNQVISTFDSAMTGAVGGAGAHLVAIQNALFDALGPNGLNLLQDSNGDGQVDASDVEVFAYHGAAHFEMTLSRSAGLDSSSAFDVGLPGLPFHLDGNLGVQVQVGYDLQLAFTVTQYAGGLPAPSFAGSTLNVTVNASTPGLDLGGHLGPLQVEAQDDPANPSNFSGTYTVSFSGDSMTGDVASDTTLTGSAVINLILSASFGASQFVDPRLSADFHLGWDFTNADTSNPAFGDFPDVEFNDITLDMGSFFDDFVGPIVSEIQVFTEQFQPVVAFLTSDVPVLSTLSEDAGGPAVTFADLIEQYLGSSSHIDDFLNTINTINTLSVSSLSGTIELGSYQITTDLREGDWNSSIPTNDSTTVATDPDAELSGSDTIQQLTGIGVDFPFLDDPSTILNLFVNPSSPISLVSWQLPNLDADFQYEQDAEVGPGVYVTFAGGLDAKVAASIGFNTSGFQTGNLLDGFTITDGLTDADGNPAFAELTVSGSGGVGLGAAYGGGATGAALVVEFSGSLFFAFNGQDSSGTIAVDEIDTGDPLVITGPPEIDVELAIDFEFGDPSLNYTYVIDQGRLWPLPFA
jgi:hypothetical protein